MGERHTGLVMGVVCDDCDIVSVRRLYSDANGRRESKLCKCVCVCVEWVYIIIIVCVYACACVWCGFNTEHSVQ